MNFKQNWKGIYEQFFWGDRALVLRKNNLPGRGLTKVDKHWCRGLLLLLITLISTYTLGKTPLNEGSALLRDLFLYNTRHLQQTNIHVPWWYSNPQFQQASSCRPIP